MVLYCSVMSILLEITELIWTDEKWTITNRMKSNISKCQILLLGKGNPGYVHKPGRDGLKSAPLEKVLGFGLMAR